MTLYLVIPRAVYYHGVIGVFTTRELAEQCAEKFWKDSDGHHELVVEEWETDAPRPERGPQRYFGKPEPTDRPLELVFCPWSDSRCA